LRADECLLFEENQLDALPSIAMMFSGALVNLRPRDYIVYAPSLRTGYQYCGVFGFAMSFSQNTTMELGFPFFKAAYTVFDLEQQMIGFAVPDNCGSCRCSPVDVHAKVVWSAL
jgi:Eukaryotic aspartyl protease